MNKVKQSKGSRVKMWLSIAGCVTLLLAGIFFAARQHFSSMDFGMKNSRLRRQIDDLESEKRRLLVAREVSLSAGELKKAAVRVKLAVVDAVTPQLASMTAPKAAPQTPAAARTSNPLIEKTVASAATNPRPVAAVQRSGAERPRTVDKKLVAKVTSAAE